MSVWLDRHYRAVLGLQWVVWSFVAWQRRFVLDDAFIALRYADNLVAGHGLVWNVGERVEGYTSLLWTLLLAVPLWLGWQPIAFIHVVGVLLLAGTLACAARLSVTVIGDRVAALWSTLLLGSNATFLAYATGGLETQLLALLITALFMVSSLPPPCTPKRALAISLLTAASLMTRLDAAIPATCAWLWLLRQMHREGLLTRKRTSLVLLTALLGPCAVLVGAWFAWKLSFYGGLLPNTFYAKVSGISAWRDGAGYVAAFLTSYLLWPCAVLVVVGAPRTVRAYPLSAALLGALLGSYGYMASVGGDFMEFRFVVPTLPLLMCAIVTASYAVLRRVIARSLLLVLVVAGSLVHALTFSFEQGIESIQGLANHLRESGQDWVGVGLALRSALPEGSDVRIATTAAGAIPYYARLPAIDMLGLTDPWIAQHGIISTRQLGHSRVSPIAYLLSRNVNLVFGHPMVQPPVPRAARAFPLLLLAEFPYFVGVSPQVLPPDAALLSIPMRNGRVVLALELVRHPDIDSAVRNATWRRFTLVR